MRGRDVVVVGGGNSAGQAAVHLARYARSVTMLVRGAGLAATMSKYLITEITSNSAITVRTRTEIVDGGGLGGLETLTVVDHTTGRHDHSANGALVSSGARRIPAACRFGVARPRTSCLGPAAGPWRGRRQPGPLER